MSAALLADAPAVLRKGLADFRWSPHGTTTPLDGHLWFTGRRVCNICGYDDAHTALAVDHCHVTGWERGHLCIACNMDEGRVFDHPDMNGRCAVFYAWRRIAPLLHLRRESFYGPRRSWLSDTDLASGLSIDELFALNDVRRVKAIGPADRFAANVIAGTLQVAS